MSLKRTQADRPDLFAQFEAQTKIDRKILEELAVEAVQEQNAPLSPDNTENACNSDGYPVKYTHECEIVPH